MSVDCDALLADVLLGRPVDDAHVAACPRCRTELPAARAVARRLAADVVPPPSPALVPRVLAAAAPILALQATRLSRAVWTRIARAVAVALVPLPLVLLVNWFVVRTIHGVLSAWLPEALSLYLVTQYVVLIALLLGLTYAAVPVLAARRLAPEDAHV